MNNKKVKLSFLIVSLMIIISLLSALIISLNNNSSVNKNFNSNTVVTDKMVLDKFCKFNYEDGFLRIDNKYVVHVVNENGTFNPESDVCRYFGVSIWKNPPKSAGDVSKYIILKIDLIHPIDVIFNFPLITSLRRNVSTVSDLDKENFKLDFITSSLAEFTAPGSKDNHDFWTKKEAVINSSLKDFLNKTITDNKKMYVGNKIDTAALVQISPSDLSTAFVHNSTINEEYYLNFPISGANIGKLNFKNWIYLDSLYSNSESINWEKLFNVQDNIYFLKS